MAWGDWCASLRHACAGTLAATTASSYLPMLLLLHPLVLVLGMRPTSATDAPAYCVVIVTLPTMPIAGMVPSAMALVIAPSAAPPLHSLLLSCWIGSSGE